MVKPIPEEDLKLINKSFEKTGQVETLGKNSFGRLVEAKKQVVNESTIVFKSFTGRILKHQKSIVLVSGQQRVLGVKGTKFDDIPLEDRNLVMWFESDFE